jgi:hypothetical protein
MNQFPLNPEPDGVCRTIKANYHKTSFANFIRMGGYGATGIAVYSDGMDMAVASERDGVRPRRDRPDINGRPP